MKMLHAFVSSGEEPDALTCECDVLAQYLRTAMHDAQVKALVLNDEVAARVFVDTMAQFVSLNLQKAAYQMQRCSYERKQIAEAAEWSHIKRRDNWQALVQMMDDKYAAQGFDKGFYNREFGEKGNQTMMLYGKRCSMIGKIIWTCVWLCINVNFWRADASCRTACCTTT